MIDVREPDDVLARIAEARRSFETGGSVPSATRRLLVELDDALGASGPLELGVTARRWLSAQAGLSRAVHSLRDDRAEVQVGDAELGLRAARHLLRLARWSARWRRWSGGTTRALRIQLAAVWVLAAIAGAVLESAFQPGGFHPIFLAVGPLLLTVAWLALFQDTTARLRDAALAREAAREIAGDQRALVGLRLVSHGRRTHVALVIATDHQLIAAQRTEHARWTLTWAEPYAQITSAAEERTDTPGVTMHAREGSRALQCRQLRRESDVDYQGGLRKALLTILDRRRGAIATVEGVFSPTNPR